MSVSKDRKDALRRYVLGTSPADEQSALDEELSRGADGTFEELEVAEADLLDAYAAGEVSPGERDQIEESYLATSPGRSRLAFALALRRRAAAEGGARRPASRWMPLAAAIGAIAIGGALVGSWDFRMREEIGRLQSLQRESARREERLTRQVEASRSEIDRLRARLESALRELPAGSLPQAAASIARLVLRTGLLREASSMPELVLATGVEWVELTLQLPTEGYRSYRVRVETPEGKLLWQSGLVAPPASSTKPDLTVRVPGHVVAGGTYIVSLTGYGPGADGEPAAEYTFRARRRP